MNTQPDSPQDQLIRSLTRLADRPQEDGLPDDAANAIAAPTERHFGFQLGPWHCAAPAALFCELLANPNISPLPNAPSLLRGLCNVRGNLIPVFELHQLNGNSAPQNRVLLLGRQHNAVGLLVDSLPVSLDLPLTTDAALATADTALAPVLLDSCLHQGTLWYRIDPVRLGPELLALCQRWDQPPPEH